MQLIKSQVWPPDLGLEFMDHVRMGLDMLQPGSIWPMNTPRFDIRQIKS